MSSCSGITGAGGRCKAIAITGSDYCYAHHPDRADARRRSASKGGKRGGRGRPSVEVSALKVQLSDLYAGVLDGTTEPKVGAVAAQIANVRARLVERGEFKPCSLIAGRTYEVLGVVEDPGE